MKAMAAAAHCGCGRFYSTTLKPLPSGAGTGKKRRFLPVGDLGHVDRAEGRSTMSSELYGTGSSQAS
jgi:hypothetical protein